jgi:tetratricopeptide (TPR) repeat protein
MKWMAPLCAATLLLAGCGIFSHHTKNKTASKTSSPAVLYDLYTQAELAYSAGNLAEAEKLFTSFTKESPTPATGYYRLACIARSKGLNSESIALNQKAKSLDTSNDYFYLLDAEISRSIRDYETAGDVYSFLSSRHPRSWSFYTDAARMYSYAVSWDKLIALCDRWEKPFGLRPDIAENRYHAYVSMGELTKAAGEWEKLVKKYPERRQYRLSLADALVNAGNYSRASSLYDSLSTEEPENITLLTNLCSFYQTQGKTELLWKHNLRVSASTKLTIEQKHNCLITFLNSQSNNPYFDSLEKPLNNILSLHNADYRAWYYLADWYFVKKRYSDAIPKFEKALSINANDFQAWSKYTESLDREKSYTKLASVADSMLEIFPTNTQVYTMGIRANEFLKNWPRAKELCESGLSWSADPQTTASFNHSLARILDNMGETELAIVKYKGLLSVNPNDHLAMNNLAYVYAIHHRNIAEAMVLVSEALKLSPENAPYLATKGWLFFGSGDYPAAITELNKAITIEKDNAVYFDHLGDAYYKSGKSTEAMASWKKAKALGINSPELNKKINTGKTEDTP